MIWGDVGNGKRMCYSIIRYVKVMRLRAVYNGSNLRDAWLKLVTLRMLGPGP